MRNRIPTDNFALSLIMLMLVAFLWSPPVAALASSAEAAMARTPPARPTPHAPVPTRGAAAVPPPKMPARTAGVLTPVPAYQGADLIRTFAATYLGTGVTVTRAYAAGANLKLPSTVQAEVDVAVEMAGQAAAGAITAGVAKGVAEVAVGQGSISGELAADISAASLGAYSLVVNGAPRDSGAALALIRSVYPALAGVDLQPYSDSAIAGYAFSAFAVHPGIDPASRQATAVVEEIVAGVVPQGKSAIVWAVIGNGTLAGEVPRELHR